MKKLTLALFLSLYVFVLTVSAANLPVPYYDQDQSNWCWVATAQSNLAYYGFYQSQCSMVANYVGDPNVCSNIGDYNFGNTIYGVGELILQGSGYNVQPIAHYNPITIDEVENLIHNGQSIPIMINNPAHAITILGADRNSSNEDYSSVTVAYSNFGIMEYSWATFSSSNWDLENWLDINPNSDIKKSGIKIEIEGNSAERISLNPYQEYLLMTTTTAGHSEYAEYYHCITFASISYWQTPNGTYSTVMQSRGSGTLQDWTGIKSVSVSGGEVEVTHMAAFDLNPNGNMDTDELWYDEVLLASMKPRTINIGCMTSSGDNNIVEFYGMSNGVCTHGYATCYGSWNVDPCNWQSYCSDGWKWDPADYYPVSSDHCSYCN